MICFHPADEVENRVVNIATISFYDLVLRHRRTSISAPTLHCIDFRPLLRRQQIGAPNSLQ
jgi:hypothetical protein